MPEALPLPPPEEDLTKRVDSDDKDEEDESEEEPSNAHLHNIKAEIEELAIVAMHDNVRVMRGFPDHVLHTDCGKEMLTTISAQYLLAEKQGKNPVDALKRALLAIGQDRGHILSKLYTDYAQRSNAFMTGVPIWKNASTVDSATIIIRKKDGTVDTTMVYRSAVQRLCESMASILGDSSYCFEKRVAMREAVATTQSVFGQELTQLALQEEESEDDA